MWPLSIGVLDEFGHLDVASVVISTLFAGFYTFASVATNTVCLGFGDERHLGQSCKIIRRPDRFCRDQEKGATCVGLVFFVPYVCRKCSCNAHNAMCNRHGVERYDSSYAFPHVIRHLARARNVAAGYYGDNLEKIRETWIYRYPYHKRVATLKSAREDAIRANRVKNMVKRETYLKRPKKARCIQFYHNMATQAFVGPEMYCLQKAYTQTLNEWSSADNSGIEITLASGMSAVALGEWMDKVNKKLPNVHYFESDGVSWDASMGHNHHVLKMWFYDFLDGDAKDFIDQGYSVRGTGRYGHAKMGYVVDGTTKSGHNDTTLGNSLVNASIAYSAMVECGLKGHILVAGDDQLIAIEGDFDEHALAMAQAKCGIVPEYRKFDHALDVSFISGVWFPTATGFGFVPKPGRLLAKLFWTCTPPSRIKLGRYVSAVAQGLLPVCRGLPIVGPFLESHYTTGRFVPTDKCLEKYADPIDFDRGVVMAAFCNKYRVGENDIVELEADIRSVGGKPGLLVNATAQRVVEFDLADLHDRVVFGTSFAGATIDLRQTD